MQSASDEVLREILALEEAHKVLGIRDRAQDDFMTFVKHVNHTIPIMNRQMNAKTSNQETPMCMKGKHGFVKAVGQEQNF